MFDADPGPYEPPYLPADPPRAPKTERRAKLHDRLKALGTFTGIAIGAVAGFEMVIGGGFDFITPQAELREVAPSSYVSVHQAPWSSEARVIPLSSTEPLFAGEFYTGFADEYGEAETPAGRLVGGYDDPAAPDLAYPDVSEREIRAQIDALYAADAGPTYTEASITYEDAPAIDAPRAETDPYAEAEAMVRQALGGYEPPARDLDPS